MLADDTFLSPLLTIESKIQSRVATFLLSREKLIKLSKSSSITVSDKAKILLVVQSNLESQLTNALGMIERLKTGAWTFSEIAGLTTFGYSLDRQIRDVEELERESFKSVSAGGIGDSWLEWVPYLILGVGGVLVVRAVVGKRRD